jgi:hypothetical protein
VEKAQLDKLTDALAAAGYEIIEFKPSETFYGATALTIESKKSGEEGQKKTKLDFPGHEEAIGILSRAEIELSKLGYRVEFTKSYSKEESLPAYANEHFALTLKAGKWKYPETSLPTQDLDHTTG